MFSKSVLFLFFTFFAVFPKGNAQCPHDGYFPDNDQCDSYIQCKKGAASRQLCPDGLVFNDKLSEFPRFPCSYPGEVDCGRRTRTQQPQPSGECKRQYGLFQYQNDCGSYLNCIAGKAHFQRCPDGLAFDESTARCLWPDQVQGCEIPPSKFQCPGIRVEADLGHPRFADAEDCRKFYVCLEGIKPREHSCGVPFVFNPELGVCDEPQNVPRCANFYPKEIIEAFSRIRQFDNNIF